MTANDRLIDLTPIRQKSGCLSFSQNERKSFWSPDILHQNFIKGISDLCILFKSQF